ncbi:MAG: OmpA family protein [Pseudomonadales bacterium]|nr:OmpA family protein [Pseudomonadales bacterium]
MEALKGIIPRSAYTAFILFFSTIVSGEGRLYKAAMHEAEWMIESSVFECKLSQTIPQFGEAHFTHRAGEPLRFRMVAASDLLADSDLALKAVPPPWNYSRSEKLLGSVELSHGSSFMLETDFARKLMNEMLTGMVPTFQGVANFDEQITMQVAVSPLHFQAAYSEYQQCSGELLPVNYDQVQRSTIFWGSNMRSLDGAAKLLLDNIVLYSRADTSIVGFEVDSFTDTVGERRDNLLISEERAFVVTNYLVSQGVDPETIATRAHGEREEYLIASPETTVADRDRNRRVNIVMVRR